VALGTKINKLVEIIRSVGDGSTSVEILKANLMNRENILGNEIISFFVLAETFGFIKTENDKLTLTITGQNFLNYVDNENKTEAEVTEILVEPVGMDAIEEFAQQSTISQLKPSTINDAFKILTEKYENNSQIITDLNELYTEITRIISNQNQIPDVELFLTASVPPGLDSSKIPIEIQQTTISHKDAIENVLQDAKKSVLISGPFVEASTLQLLVGNTYTTKLNCKLIISNGTIELEKYNLLKIETFLKNHFNSFEIRVVDKPQIKSHAKVWISEKSVHITSANILPFSQTDNFELGIYSSNNILVHDATLLFDKVWSLGEPVKL
tara:strand:- start:7528 stop:8505 length:978 start_codon:yes stop_codon:yes gene_type:complete